MFDSRNYAISRRKLSWGPRRRWGLRHWTFQRLLNPLGKDKRTHQVPWFLNLFHSISGRTSSRVILLGLALIWEVLCLPKWARLAFQLVESLLPLAMCPLLAQEYQITKNQAAQFNLSVQNNFGPSEVLSNDLPSVLMPKIKSFRKTF